MYEGRLLEIRDLAEILISVVEVLTAHTPNEGVVMGSGRAMD